MPAKIELLKIRDFGEIITDTFGFVRENFKPLIKCFFIFCGFFLVAAALFSTLQQIKTVGTINNTGFMTPRFFQRSRTFDMFGVEYFLTIFFVFLNQIALQVTVFSYVCLYKEKGNIPPSPQEVWGYFKYFFMRILGSAIPLFILLIVASALCLVPGIYLYPIFALIFPIMIFENTSFGYAFSYSFKLIKNNWWLTFGAIVIMILIVYVASMAILLPIALINVINMLLHIGKGMHLSITITVITTILNQLYQLFYILPIITVSLCYFSLKEQSDAIGLMGRINKLGNTNTDTSLPAEEF